MLIQTIYNEVETMMNVLEQVVNLLVSGEKKLDDETQMNGTSE